MFAYGYNMPGYMPESDPSQAEGFTDAIAGLLEDLRGHHDQDLLAIHAEDSEEALALKAQYAEAVDTLNKAITTPFYDITVYYGQYVYWILEDAE